MTPQAAIAALLAGRRLSAIEAEAAMGGIADGDASPSQIGALLALLASRGASGDEIAGFARALRSRALPVAATGALLDTCGTGGDGAGTFNISTLAALVVAAAGGRVAKHGNRAVSSRVGSADLLEALGVRVDLDAAGAIECLDATGFTFLFAPLYHPAWRHVAAARRELGVRTVFNVLGPLVNPAGPDVQLLGVYDAALVPLLAQVLGALGRRRALVVHGEAGEDEISLAGATRVAEWRDGRVVEALWRPEDAGIEPQPLPALRGGGLEENVSLARRVLEGQAGAPLDAVALNAGAALYVAGLAADWTAGVETARALLARGAVRAKLEQITAFCRSAT